MTADAPALRPRTRLTPDARRHQVVLEATRLIARAGFNAVSLGDIADACGIRKSSVLHYFPTMGDLLRGVLAQRDVEVGKAHPPPTGLDTPQGVDAYLRVVIRANLESRELIRLFVVLRTEAFDSEHPAHEYFAERDALARAELEAMLSWKADPTTAALELLSFWQGLESIWVNNPSVDFQAVWDSFAERFFV
jgi:AcrR family transcriptional regulator